MNYMNVDYSTKIPKQRESRRGPPSAEGAGGLASPATWIGGATWAREGFQQSLVYLGATGLLGSIRRGWAKFDYVKMPEISLGHSLSSPGRQIASSRSAGELRQAGLAGRCPASHRGHACQAGLIVDPGRHPRPAFGSEQQAPSRQDPRPLAVMTCANLFPGQCRGRSPSLGDWSICCRKYFGRERPARRARRNCCGRPLGRRGFAAHARRPFNEADAGLAVVLHVHLFHRPQTAKMQLHSLAQSGFDPLFGAPARFMLTERRRHHMFRRRDRHQPRDPNVPCEAIGGRPGIDDPNDVRQGPPRASGVIDLPTMQKRS